MSEKKKNLIREEQKSQISEEPRLRNFFPWDFLITGLGEKVSGLKVRRR